MRGLFGVFSRWWAARVPPVPPPRALPKPVPLKRVFPPLVKADEHLARERDNRPDEIDITIALEALRGGQARDRPQTRATRPARFFIAHRHVDGFAHNCLMVHSQGHIRAHDMYAGYLLWASQERQEPISLSDFDFAMADHLAQIGGIRDDRGYRGCRFRPDFVRRLDDLNSKEAKRRLGMGLHDLMAGKRPGSE